MSGDGAEPALHPNSQCERVDVDIDLDVLRSTGRLVKISGTGEVPGPVA